MKNINKLAITLGWISILPISLATITSCNNGKATATVIVTFDLAGGKIEGMTGTTMTIVSGTTYGQLPSPILANKIFSHWTVNGKKVSSSTIITSNVTVKANYIDASEAVTVTFDLAGGNIPGMSGNTMKVLKGTIYGQLPCPSKTNSLFTFWSKNGVEMSDDEIIDTDISIKANYGTITPSWTITEPATAAERIGLEKASVLTQGETGYAIYNFTFPGEFTIPDVQANNIEWFATISGQAEYNNEKSSHSLRVSGGTATQTTGDKYKLSIDVKCKQFVDEYEKPDNSNFLLCVKPNTNITVSDLLIVDKTTQKAYFCTEEYYFSIVPKLALQLNDIEFYPYEENWYGADYHAFWFLNIKTSSETGYGKIKLTTDTASGVITESKTDDQPYFGSDYFVEPFWTYEEFKCPSLTEELSFKIGYEVVDPDGSTILLKKDITEEPIISGKIHLV